MKRRILFLTLALILALSVAAPVFAINIGESFSKEELDEMGLRSVYAGFGGCWVEGEWLNMGGSIFNGTLFMRSGSKFYIDEDGNLYMFMQVMRNGEIVYQAMLVSDLSKATDNFMDEMPLYLIDHTPVPDFPTP